MATAKSKPQQYVLIKTRRSKFHTENERTLSFVEGTPSKVMAQKMRDIQNEEPDPMLEHFTLYEIKPVARIRCKVSAVLTLTEKGK